MEWISILTNIERAPQKIWSLSPCLFLSSFSPSFHFSFGNIYLYLDFCILFIWVFFGLYQRGISKISCSPLIHFNWGPKQWVSSPAQDSSNYFPLVGLAEVNFSPMENGVLLPFEGLSWIELFFLFLNLFFLKFLSFLFLSLYLSLYLSWIFVRGDRNLQLFIQNIDLIDK